MDPVRIGLLTGGIVLLLILSALFSICETSYSAANKVRLRHIEGQGGKNSKRAKKMLKKLDRFDKVLTTILVGNTIVTVVAASLATVLFVALLDETIGTIVSSVTITAVAVVFCEITPKVLSKEKPEKTGMSILPFLSMMMILFWPFTAIFSLWKKLLNKIFKVKNEATVTEDELLTYVETAESDGEIEHHESELIKSAIEFEDTLVEDIMIPRVQVVAVSSAWSMNKIDDRFKEHGFSRMPVYNDTIDQIIGVLHLKDFEDKCLDNKEKLRSVLQEAPFFAPSSKISTVLRDLQKKKLQMAIVVDEHGGTEGIVTMEDILEELVGEIWDEHDDEEVLTKRVGDGIYEVAGSENLEKMLEELEVKTSEEFDSTTVGGFLTELHGKIPAVGESVEFENLDITVTKANVKKVLEAKVRVREVSENERDEEDE